MKLHRVIGALRGRGGFTLIEVLVTAAMLGVTLSAILKIFNAQQRTYIVQNRVADMQQAGRAALGILARDIRSAGFGVPDGAAIRTTNSASGPDQITLTGNLSGGTATPILVHNKASGFLTVATGTYNSSIVGSLMLLYDSTDYHAVRVTAFTAGATDRIDYLDSTSPIVYSTGQNKDFTGGTATPVESRSYLIDTATPTRPRLIQNRNLPGQYNTVADDVEDLQIAYGLDTNSDGVVDAWQNTPASYTQVRLVRVTLIARSSEKDEDWGGSRPGFEDRPAGAAADGYRRAVYQTTEMVRNLPL